MSYSLHPFRLAAILVTGGFALGCDGASDAAPAISRDTAPAVPAKVAARPESARRPALTPIPSARRPKLSPLADSISRYLVFHAQNLPVLTIASRDGHFLLDIGRVDTKLATPERHAAFKEAVVALAPLKIGDRLRVHGPWGASDATISGFEAWNSRIVGKLDLPPAVDSLAKTKETVVAAATRETAQQPPTTDDCRRQPPPELLAAARAAKDSITRGIRLADTTTLPERLAHSRRVQSSIVYGCFAPDRAPSALVLVALVAGDYEFGREQVVVVDATGSVKRVVTADSRFRIHELMHALDADGDGVDDVAVKGKGIRIGDTAVLHYNPTTAKLERLTGGFSWESM